MLHFRSSRVLRREGEFAPCLRAPQHWDDRDRQRAWEARTFTSIGAKNHRQVQK